VLSGQKESKAMGLEIKTEKIGEYTYRVTMLGARESGRVFFRLCNMFAPIFDGLDIKTAKGSVKASEELIPAVFAGMSRGMANLKDADYDFLINAFAKTTEVEYPPERDALGNVRDRVPRLDKVFDEHFAGHFEDQMKWLLFCVEANYSSFLDVIKAKLDEKSKKQAAPESST
jgi:hypothetical protein